MVAHTGLMIFRRAVAIGLIALGMMIDVVIRLGDTEHQLAGMLVSHAGGMLDPIDHAGRRGAGEHKRQRHAKRDDQCSELWRQSSSHIAMLRRVAPSWQGG